MESQKYNILYEPGEAEIVEKKSRFIAHAAPAKTEEEARWFIEKIKKQYWDARHNCWAYRVGINQPAVRCSDDGEPGGTAGKPMLEVILGEDLWDVVVVVTRYFGGTLLGTGGLIRAYTKSTQEGIQNSRTVIKCLGQELMVACDYTTSGKIGYLAAEEKIPVLHTEYTDKVEFHMIVPLDQAERVKKKFTEVSLGKALIREHKKRYFAELDGEIKLLEE